MLGSVFIGACSMFGGLRVRLLFNYSVFFTRAKEKKLSCFAVCFTSVSVEKKSTFCGFEVWCFAAISTIQHHHVPDDSHIIVIDGCCGFSIFETWNIAVFARHRQTFCNEHDWRCFFAEPQPPIKYQKQLLQTWTALCHKIRIGISTNLRRGNSNA